ncbi:MAG: NAD-dependent epimerase/dehydratase family protein [Thermoleophilia bacterium]
MSTVIVTGGAGFIGSNLADALIADGHTVHVVDDLSHGTREKVPADAVFHQVDIRDQTAMAALTREADPDVVFHLAAQADVRRAIEDPAFDAAVNVAGTLNVLEAARAVGAKVVFASTGGAGYGEYEGLDVPTPESAQTRPLSHYGMSKMAAEGYCGLYERLYGMDTVVLRLGNVYGPRQDPHGEAGVVAIFAGRMLDGIPPTVFGDGLQTRDYVYVGDVVRGFMAAADRAPAGSVINIGNSAEVTVLDLIEGLGGDLAPEFKPARLGELQRSALDNRLAKSLLGWEPQMPLDEGLQATYRSIAEHRRNPDARPPGFLEVAATA